MAEKKSKDILRQALLLGFGLMDLTKEKIEKDADRDFWMTADVAKQYGLVDKVITKR